MRSLYPRLPIPQIARRESSNVPGPATRDMSNRESTSGLGVKPSPNRFQALTEERARRAAISRSALVQHQKADPIVEIWDSHQQLIGDERVKWPDRARSSAVFTSTSSLLRKPSAILARLWEPDGPVHRDGYVRLIAPV